MGKQWQCPNCGSKRLGWGYVGVQTLVWLCDTFDCYKLWKKEEIQAITGRLVDGSNKDEELPELPADEAYYEEITWTKEGGLWKPKFKCECGAQSIGVNSHSHWCPCYGKD